MKPWNWLFILFFSSSCFSATIAYRFNTTLYVIPDDSMPTEVIPISKVTGSYHAGSGIVAFRNGSSLYIASTLSNWKPIFVDEGVTGTEVRFSTILYRKGNELYKVMHPSSYKAFGQLIAPKILDYDFFSDDQFYSVTAGVQSSKSR